MTDTDTNIRLGFVDIAVFPDGSIRGGILITDIDTRPYEFRVTSPVKPTQLQQVLYGSSLREYVYGELICAPLVKSSKEKLSLVMVKETNLLAIRDTQEISVPVILIRQEPKAIKSEDGKEGIKPVTILAHKKYPGEEGWAQTILSPIMQLHDLFEPFERVHTALAEVHKSRVEEKNARA
jgi:hypothetical protein